MKCKSVILVINLFVILSFCRAQNFEGIVVYTNVLKTNNSSQSRAESDTLFIKGNMVKSPWANPEIGYSLKIGDKFYYINHFEQTILNDTSYSDSLFVSKDLFQSVKQRRKKAEVANYTCSKFKRIKDRNGIDELSTLFIADSLRVDVNFGYLLYKDLGIALRVIVKTENGSFVKEVYSLEQKKLKSELFKLPNYQIKKISMKKLAKSFIK